MPGTVFALGVISSVPLLALAPLGCTDSRSYHQALMSDRARRHSMWQVECMSSQEHTGLLGSFLIWGSELGRFTPSQIVWSEWAPYLVLQKSETTGWGYYLGTARVKWVCQDPYAGCCKPIPLFWLQSDFQWLGFTDSFAVPVLLY